MRITKQISRFNKSTGAWDVLTGGIELKTGERALVTLTIETPKALQYVYIHDPKAAAVEPVAYNSGYRGDGDFPFYESLRDAGRDFYATFIPAERTEVRYEMNVTQEGCFSSGMASLECMYQPETSAYSNNLLIQVKESK
jgi:alpha-2-macroglobulin